MPALHLGAISTRSGGCRPARRVRSEGTRANSTDWRGDPQGAAHLRQRGARKSASASSSIQLSLDHVLTWANAQPRTAAFDADGRGLNSSTHFTPPAIRACSAPAPSPRPPRVLPGTWYNLRYISTADADTPVGALTGTCGAQALARRPPAASRFPDC